MINEDNVTRLAEKIHALHCDCSNTESHHWKYIHEKIESLLREAMEEEYERGVKDHERGGYTLKDIWDARDKAVAEAYTRAAEVASQCPLDEDDPIAWVVAAIERLKEEKSL